ncbi:carboxylesterase [Herbiconiux sp. L3-i23]|uniref:alpha/beta hydrolase n=1 Tax=Herbiconiux sp. L3-i23 TaxID=2905871 RepID=UPI0020451894|nr:alpha/beta hydrolase [Herbiconiux sp. L3-i23]BDI22845.1 alpha/beta hydrolase [Herbiconiux sp. L3-i23]
MAADIALTEWELAEIERANQSGLRPVMFVHGLWLLASSWQPWRDLFEAAGYTTIAPGWPDDPDSVAAAKADPDVFAHKMVGQVTDHYLEAIEALTIGPAIVGHSFGGLIAQRLAGQGVSVATVAIDPAPFQGVLPLPVSALKSAAPILGNPANIGRAVALTYDQYKFGWANNLDDIEARRLYDTYHVPASGVPLFQAATANLNPFAETKVDSKNPDRGPLLILAGTADNTVPLAMAEAAYKLQARNSGVTELVEVPDRGHSLIIDAGWREVADTALDFVTTYAATPVR